VIEVLRAPAFAAIQDGGRDGGRAAGIPPGGALDALSLRGGNALLGNPPGAAAIEWALTGGALRFHTEVFLVLTGARVDASLDGTPVSTGQVLAARAGSELTIERIVSARVVYVCVAGGLDVPVVLGGRGTYLPAGFGGLEGRLLRAGDRLRTGPFIRKPRVGAWLPPEADIGESLAPDRTRSIACLLGPDTEALSAEGWVMLLDTELTVDARSDRIGYRLTGLGAIAGAPADRKSQPTCVGAVQLTPDGTLIVLMPDGPTVGGYPKIAVVATADLPRLAQLQAGERVSLRLIGGPEALAALREQEAALRRI
jgi:biotin-dependent carboxylase-like uncharacterized protein